MHPNDLTPESVGCLVVRKHDTSLPASLAGMPAGLIGWDCAYWSHGVVHVATLFAPIAPTFTHLEMHRGIFPSAWTPLPAKPLA